VRVAGGDQTSERAHGARTYTFRVSRQNKRAITQCWHGPACALWLVVRCPRRQRSKVSPLITPSGSCSRSKRPHRSYTGHRRLD